MPVDRRFLLTSALGSLAAAALPAAAAPAPRIEVWKSPTCGCCGDWVAYLRRNGFDVVVSDVDSPARERARLGMPDEFGSCHTGRVAGYALEGHVPAREIRRLLAEKPAIVGLSVPGMPLGSPGMDGPAYGGKAHAYEVLAIDRKGRATPFARYPGNQPA
jgi:hypothetical protein